MTAHTQQPQFIDHRYPNDVIGRMTGWLFAYDSGGDPTDINSLPIGMNGESAERFGIDAWFWLWVRGDTVKVVAS